MYIVDNGRLVKMESNDFDKSKLIDIEYDSFSIEEKRKLHQMIKSPDTNAEIRGKVEKLLYYRKPPTVDEFFDYREGWLKKSTIDSLYTWVRDTFYEIIENSAKYDIISFYGATRIGKSMFSRLLMLYTHIYMHYLRDPQLYMGVSPDTNLTQYLICFDYKKTKQLLISPLFKLIQKSERFKLVHKSDQVVKKQKEFGRDYIVYSTAAKTGEITVDHGLQIQLGNDSPLAIIGSDILQAYVTEIAFFIEKAGTTEKEIFRLYSDSVERISATIGKNRPFSFTLLDSSANRENSIIEKHILKELVHRDNVFFIRKSRWDVDEIARKHFPTWVQTKETFPICTGDGSHPAKILETQAEIDDIPKSLLMHIPIDAKPAFQENIAKSIKDIAGMPTSDENKLIQDRTLIDGIFDTTIPNIDNIIIADSMDEPNKLIWDKIYPTFFSRHKENSFITKRAHLEPRYIHIDPAYSTKGDVMGIACVHKERDFINKKDIYVVDFAFPVGPGANEINLASIEHFIFDLYNIGFLNIKKVTSDSFQNKQFEQDLKRRKIDASTVSIDISLDPYLFLITQMFNGNIRCGKNIFLKNNLDSLIRTRLPNGKEKIDHTIGETNNKYYGDWEKSTCGIHAKDQSEAVRGAIWRCYNEQRGSITDYNLEQKRFSKDEEDVNMLINSAFKMIHKHL